MDVLDPATDQKAILWLRAGRCTAAHFRSQYLPPDQEKDPRRYDWFPLQAGSQIDEPVQMAVFFS
ncbi:hypothetical protein ACIBQ6_25300 [Nonomuraea sp. NPDC049655]|uniref:hypothetical protein n=1 Tax=Nonomuraea sp. NPDC049655 TaxID=3364355 RepID=UPI0037BB8ECF